MQEKLRDAIAYVTSHDKAVISLNTVKETVKAIQKAGGYLSAVADEKKEIAPTLSLVLEESANHLDKAWELIQTDISEQLEIETQPGGENIIQAERATFSLEHLDTIRAYLNGQLCFSGDETKTYLKHLIKLVDYVSKPFFEITTLNLNTENLEQEQL